MRLRLEVDRRLSCVLMREVRLLLQACLAQAAHLQKRACRQWKGFSPVWVLVCAVRPLDCAKRLPQPGCGQWKRAFLVWVLVCAVRLLARAKLMPQPACGQS